MMVLGVYQGKKPVHADRGLAMTSKPVALLRADLGVTNTHAWRLEDAGDRSPLRAPDATPARDRALVIALPAPCRANRPGS